MMRGVFFYDRRDIPHTNTIKHNSNPVKKAHELGGTALDPKMG